MLLGLLPTACGAVSSCRPRRADLPVAYDLAARAAIAELESPFFVARLASPESDRLQEKGFRRLAGPGSDEAAAIAPRATFLLPVPDPAVARRLVVDLQPEEAGKGKEIEVSLDATVLGRVRLDGPRQQVAFDVPAGIQRSPRQRLKLVFPEEEAARGNKRAGAPAARVFHIVLAAADAVGLHAVEAAGSPAFVREGVLYQAPSRLRFALLKPPHGRVTFLPALRADALAGSSVQARILHRDGSGERELWAERVRAGARPEPVALELPGEDGAPFELTLVAESPSDPAAPFLAWGAPRVLGDSVVDPLQQDPPAAPTPGPTVDGVLFVIFDAARARQFGTYGYAKGTTPEVDRLAKEGIVFEHHVTQVVTTSPSMATIWSSQYPDQGQSEWLHDGKMPGNRMTLAELLTAQGIETAGFIANPSAGPTVGLDRGFATFERLYREPWHTGEPPRADIFRKALFPWIDAGRKGRFLLYAHWREPHTPYADVLDGPDAPLPPDAKWYQWWAPVNSGQRPVTPEEKDHLVRLYDGNLHAADAAFGALRRKLEQAGLWDRIAVILTGDHGEALFEHGYTGHNVQVYDESVRVPMIVKLPAAFALAGKRVGALTAHLDVAPTIAELLGVAGRGGSDRAFRGRSLLTVARTGQGSRGYVSRTIEARPTYAVIDARFKLLHDLPTGEEELYDLEQDPGEKNDLAAEQPMRVDALRQSLFRWLLDMRSSDGGEVEPASIDETDAEVLKALGYVK